MWPWRRHRNGNEAREARQTAEHAVAVERERLVEVSEVVARLAAHRNRNNFAEQMRIAFGDKL